MRSQSTGRILLLACSFNRSMYVRKRKRSIHVRKRKASTSNILLSSIFIDENCCLYQLPANSIIANKKTMTWYFFAFSDSLVASQRSKKEKPNDKDLTEKGYEKGNLQITAFAVLKRPRPEKREKHVFHWKRRNRLFLFSFHILNRFQTIAFKTTAQKEAAAFRGWKYFCDFLCDFCEALIMITCAAECMLIRSGLVWPPC